MKTNLIKSNLPSKWNQVNLGEVGSVLTGGTPSTGTPEYWGGSILWMSSGEVNKRRVYDTEKRITEAGLKSSNATLLPRGAVMIALAGQGKTRGKVAVLEVESTCNQSLAAIIPNKDELISDFLFYSLERRYQELRNISGGEGRAGLNLRLIKDVKIELPPLPEQKKIAEILSTVDDEITKTEEIISATEKLKSGLMRKMFSGKGVNTKLGEIASIVRGGSPRPIEDYITDEPDGLNWLKIGDIDQGAKYITHTSQKIKQAGLKKTTMVHSGDFILSNSMSFGRPYIMKIDACIHDGWLAFKDVNTDLIDSEFLYYLLSSELLQKNFTAVAAGSGVKNLKRESVSNIVVKLPPLDKQKEITRILSSVDDRVTVHKKIRSNLILLKKGLMQDLLTGKVRTI